MADPLMLRRVQPGFEPEDAPPAFYFCSEDRIDLEAAGKIMGAGITGELADSLFSGVLLPYFMHNANNLLVGVMGNLDLAGMFMPDAERVEPKLNAARTATGSVVDYIRTVTSSITGNPGDSSRGSLAAPLNMIRAASGRSVMSESLGNLTGENALYGVDCSLLSTVVRGMGTWCLLCLGGNGELRGNTGSRCMELEWKRPESAGRSHMPGGESAADVMAVTAGLAVSGGMTVFLEKWTDTEGKVSIVFKSGS